MQFCGLKNHLSLKAGNEFLKGMEHSRNPAAGQETGRKSFEGFQAHLLNFDWIKISEIAYEKQFVKKKYIDNGWVNVYRI